MKKLVLVLMAIVFSLVMVGVSSVYATGSDCLVSIDFFLDQEYTATRAWSRVPRVNESVDLEVGNEKMRGLVSDLFWNDDGSVEIYMIYIRPNVPPWPFPDPPTPDFPIR